MDYLTVATLVQALQEPNTDLLTKVLRVLGQDRCAAILADTLQREANGGMLTKDGTRRRTPGGVFFQLVREQATKQERRRLFPQPALQRGHGQPQGQPTVLTWDEARTLIQTLATEPLGGCPRISANSSLPPG